MACIAIAICAMTGNTMTDTSDTPTREDRLAAKLRENLRRRKAQGRELRDGGDTDLSKPGTSG